MRMEDSGIYSQIAGDITFPSVPYLSILSDSIPLKEGTVLCVQVAPYMTQWWCLHKALCTSLCSSCGLGLPSKRVICGLATAILNHSTLRKENQKACGTKKGGERTESII